MGSEKTVLIVEDNDKDAELIIMAMDELSSGVKLDRVRDGVEAMEYLFQQNKQGQKTVLLLLDIKLPRMNGLEVLAKVKSDDYLRTIPVVMLTSSREVNDLNVAYSKGANAYVVKPVEFNELLNSLRCTGEFWCRVNELPE